MEAQLPFLDVLSPDGDSLRVEIDKDQMTIGRFPGRNDIALQPDPQQLVTRITHCTIERDASGWWIRDNDSVNKTFLRWNETVKVVDGKALIGDGDVIRILGRLSEEGEPSYWELTFHDPLKTRPAPIAPPKNGLAYDWLQAKLFLIKTGRMQEITGLGPQEHKLIRYMDQRNRANGYVPVMCGYDELLEAIWGEESYDHTEADVNHLAWRLRSKIEPNASEPIFLETVRGLGYRLATRPLDE